VSVKGWQAESWPSVSVRPSHDLLRTKILIKLKVYFADTRHPLPCLFCVLQYIVAVDSLEWYAKTPGWSTSSRTRGALTALRGGAVFSYTQGAMPRRVADGGTANHFIDSESFNVHRLLTGSMGIAVWGTGAPDCLRPSLLPMVLAGSRSI
jgi:hypothetical protein